MIKTKKTLAPVDRRSPLLLALWAMLFALCSLPPALWAQPSGLFSRLTTTEPSSASATIAGGIVAGVTRNQIIDFSGRIPALTPQYFVSLDASQLTGIPSATHNLLSTTHLDTLATAPVLGAIIYGNTTPAWQTLAGNVTTTKMFLNQTGTGAVSAAPAWAALIDADIPDTITLSNLTQVTTRSHASLQNLTADDHTVYALLAGRSGGQTIKGGTAAADGLTLQATSGVGVGSEFIKCLLGNNGATEACRITPAGFGVWVVPTSPFHVEKTISTGLLASFLATLDTPHASDTNDAAISANITLSANSATNELVLRGFRTTVTNSLTGGGAVQNIRAFNLNVSDSASTTTTSLNGMYVERGIKAGTVTTAYGMHITDMGSAGTATAAAVALQKPTLSTNNYYFDLDTADATACTITGRLPVLIGGVAKFIPYC